MTSETFVVTGGAQGIGAGIVARLVADGHRVAIIDIIDPDPSVLAESGGRVSFIHADLSVASEARRAAREALAELGHVYSLVHCAAYIPLVSFAELTDDLWEKSFAVNVTSAFALTQELTPSMRERKSGRVVLFASSTMFAPAPNMSHYVATKGAVIGFARALAHELGPDFITVNAIAPGLTATAGSVTTIPQQHFDLVASRQAIPRTGQIDDQVAAVSYLVSPEAGFMTGQTLLVDGGESHI